MQKEFFVKEKKKRNILRRWSHLLDPSRNSYLALEDTLKMILRKMTTSYWMAALFMFPTFPQTEFKNINLENNIKDFPEGPVVKNLPYKAGDIDLLPLFPHLFAMK